MEHLTTHLHRPRTLFRSSFPLLRKSEPPVQVQDTIITRSEVVRAVIVRTCKELKRDNRVLIRYDDNAAIVIDQEGNPKGTRIFGAIARELRHLNFTKITQVR